MPFSLLSLKKFLRDFFQMIKVYDFDKTLTYDDTTLMFLYFCCNFLKTNKSMKKILVLFFAVLHKFKFLSNTEFKALSFGLVFKGRSKQVISDISRAFSEEKNNIFNNLGNKVIAGSGKSQYVITASPECYVQMFFKNLIVIGTVFHFDSDGIYAGIKRNCFGSEKVIAIQERGISEINQFYTDSYSDRPMMEISDHIFLVKGDRITEI